MIDKLRLLLQPEVDVSLKLAAPSNPALNDLWLDIS